jgi:PAS domain-containing protein
VEFLAEIAGTLLFFLNAPTGWAWLPFRRRTSYPATADVKLDFGIEAVRPSGANRNHILCGFLLDTSFHYCDMSESFCEMLGLQRADLIGRSAEDITPADFVDLAAVREEIRRCGKKIGSGFIFDETAGTCWFNIQSGFARTAWQICILSPFLWRPEGLSCLSDGPPVSRAERLAWIASYARLAYPREGP